MGFASDGQHAVFHRQVQGGPFVDGGLGGSRQRVQTHPVAPAFTDLGDELVHVACHAYGVSPGQQGPVGAGHLVGFQKDGAHAISRTRRVGHAVVVDAIVGGHLIAFLLRRRQRSGNDKVGRVGVVNRPHNGPAAVAQTFVDHVAKRFLGRFKVPMHVGQPVGDVDVGHDRGFSPHGAHDQVGHVAHVLVFAVERHLSHAVHQGLHARSRVVGVARTKHAIGHVGDPIPLRGGLVEALQDEGASGGFSRKRIGAVPHQIHRPGRSSFRNVHMDGAQEVGHVRHRHGAVFFGFLNADVAMGQLVGVVEEGGHHPTGGQNQVAVDDFRGDDVPLVAQGVGLQIKHLDLVLQELLFADGGKDVPMQRGVPRGIHVVHVGEVGRRQLGGHRRALRQGHPRQQHAREDTNQGGRRSERRLGRHEILHINSCNARKTD